MRGNKILFKYFGKPLWLMRFCADTIFYAIYMNGFIIPHFVSVKIPSSCDTESIIVFVNKLDRNGHRAISICISIESTC